MDGGFEMDSGSIDETNDLINQDGFMLNEPIQYNGFLPDPLLTGDRVEDCSSSIGIVRQFSHNLSHTTFGHSSSSVNSDILGLNNQVPSHLANTGLFLNLDLTGFPIVEPHNGQPLNWQHVMQARWSNDTIQSSPSCNLPSPATRMFPNVDNATTGSVSSNLEDMIEIPSPCASSESDTSSDNSHKRKRQGSSYEQKDIKMHTYNPNRKQRTTPKFVQPYEPIQSHSILLLLDCPWKSNDRIVVESGIPSLFLSIINGMSNHYNIQAQLVVQKNKNHPNQGAYQSCIDEEQDISFDTWFTPKKFSFTSASHGRMFYRFIVLENGQPVATVDTPLFETLTRKGFKKQFTLKCEVADYDIFFSGAAYHRNSLPPIEQVFGRGK